MSKKPSAKQQEEPEETLPALEKINATFARERVLAEEQGPARQLYDHSRFGKPKDNKMNYSLVEALYLLDKGKINVMDGKKNITSDQFIRKARKAEPNFWIRYCVFRDLRSRGYVVKTALKFGADFRVYDRGVKPGEDHARWIVFPIHEGDTLTWYEFAAKNRVAHSTRKRLLLAIVDEENSVTFYECRWLRP